MMLHSGVSMRKSDCLKGINTRQLISLSKYFQVHHVINDNRETHMSTFFRYIPAHRHTGNRIIAGSQKICSIYNRLTPFFICSNTIGITITAIDYKADIVISDNLRLAVEFLCMLLCKNFGLLITSIHMYIPECSRIKSGAPPGRI